MSNNTKQWMDDIKRNVIPGLNLPKEFILPAYHNQSILNIPASICEFFEIPIIHASPLRPEIISPLQGGVRRVLVILMDALALHRFTSWLLDKKLPIWTQLLQSGILAPITSIVPSTTSSAITTLWTGRTVAEHGVAGYELWLKQYGLVANMIQQAPMSYKGGGAHLEKAGFEAETTFSFPKLGEHLRQHGILPYSFQHYSIAHSGLSRTFIKDVTISPFGTQSECWVNLRTLIESKKDEKLYLWTYWSEYDTLSHRYGPDNERSELDFINFSRNFEQNFLNRLSAELRDGTLLILTADHGQVHTEKNPHFNLKNHPTFLDCLHIKPTGENRLIFLHVRPGKEKILREYIENTWAGQFILVKSKKLLDQGLFGSGDPMPDMINRIGDYTLIAKNEGYLWWSEDENPLLGRHGGLTPQEMLVPFMAVRL